jgi:hypothetical protein
LKSRVLSTNRLQCTGLAPSKFSGGSARVSRRSLPCVCRITPPPSTTANQRSTPSKREKLQAAVMSATDMRTFQWVASGSASSSRVMPRPLRQGCGTIESRSTSCQFMPGTAR